MQYFSFTCGTRGMALAPTPFQCPKTTQKVLNNTLIDPPLEQELVAPVNTSILPQVLFIMF